MIKNLKVFKRIISLLLIFLLSIKSIAAEVSNNDGSAFITKAEFDTLKSNFQSMIDTYNQGIDSKIDNAIESYLKGISINQKQKLNSLLNSVNAIAGGQKVMAKAWYPHSTRHPVGAILLNFAMMGEGGDYRGGAFVRQGSTSGSPRYQIEGVEWKADAGSVTDNSYRTGCYNFLSNCNYGYYFKGFAQELEYSFLICGANAGTQGGNDLKLLKNNNFGARWAWQDAIVSNNYWSIEPGAIQFKAYLSDGVTDTPGISFNIALGTSYAVKHQYDYETPIIGQAENGYLDFIWDEEIQYTQNMQGTYTIQPYIDQAYIFYDNKSSDGTGDYWQCMGLRTLNTIQANNSFKASFKQNKIRSIKETDIVDYSVSNVMQKAIGISSGIPLCKVPKKGKLTAKITFHNLSGTDNVICAFNKGEFPNNSTYNNNADLKLTTTSYPSDVEQTIVMEVNTNDTIWLKGCASNDAWGYVWVETSDLELEIEK